MLSKSALKPLGLKAGASSANAGIIKKLSTANHKIDNFKQRNERYHK